MHPASRILMKMMMRILRIIVCHVLLTITVIPERYIDLQNKRLQSRQARDAGKTAEYEGFQWLSISDRISRANARLLSSSVISVSNLTEWLTSTSSRMSWTKTSGIPP